MRSSARSLSRLVIAVAALAASLGGGWDAARAQDAAEELAFTATEGDGGVPRSDDVIGGRLFRGPSTAPKLEFDGPRVYEIASDGSRTLVALSVSNGTISAALMPADEALAIPADTLAGLRGISFDGWSERFAPMLRAIDPQRCVVDISVGLRGRVPPLPDGLRALRVEGFLDEPIDLSGLASQTGMRMLTVDHANVSDWSPLAGMSELLHLEASVMAPTASTVPTLPALTTFAAGYDAEVTDVSFLARFPELLEANLHSTSVTDLSPIERLPKIRQVLATNAEVTKLPTGAIPSLRKLTILGHSVPPEALRAFLDANPQCATTHSWRDLLDASVAEVDGLRLRTGGQCHRSPLEEDTLFETSDVDELRALIAMIAIDEPASRGFCSCCGGPTIELVRDGEIAGALTMHHGQSLRWHGWPCDGRLTDDSADALCEWLTERGASVLSPLQVAARDSAEAKERDAAQDGLLGRERGAAIRACADAGSFAVLVRAAAPEIADRIVLLLRLSALSSPADDSPGALLVKRAGAALQTQDAQRLGAVLLELLTSTDTARELLESAAMAVRGLDDDDSPLPAEMLAALRLPAARVFITSADAHGPFGRRNALRLLERQETPEADALAMSMLPALNENGDPVTQPTRDDMELAQEIVRFCADDDLPHLRALAAASRNPEGWGEHIEWMIERRRRNGTASDSNEDSE